MQRHVFDLDGTLVYTDSLNNESYNYALKQFGLPMIDNPDRITRDVVFRIYPELEDIERTEIIILKQKYFASNVRFTLPNNSLIDVLKAQVNDACLLWTSADETRVNAILKHYNLGYSFSRIIFSDKRDLFADIVEMCTILDCGMEDLIIYENKATIIRALRELSLNVIEVKQEQASC